jgi:hypothetical protein
MKKLFVWQGDGVLTDHTNGIMFALADDVDSARQAIINKISHDGQGDPDRLLLDYTLPDAVKALVISETEGFYLEGGG